MVPRSLPAPSPPLPDQIDAILMELVPLLDQDRPGGRGRPTVMGAGLVWGALLTAVLRGGSSLRGVWRTIAITGLWHYPAVDIGAEGVRARLLALGAGPMEQLFTLVTTALRERSQGDATLAPGSIGGVYAMDTTTLDKVARFLGTATGPHAALAGQVHTLFDVRRQLFTAIIPTDLPTQNEQVAAPDLIATLPPNSLLLMDRGYTSYPRFDALTDAGQAFITRLRSNASVVTRWVMTDTRELRDELVWLGKHRADRAGHPYRVITFRVGQETRQYLTNVCSPEVLAPVTVHRLYRRRWDIERAFKTVKGDLGLAAIWATRWELILIQIWATLVIAQIASALRQEVALRAGVPVEEVSLELLLKVLPRLAAHAAQTGQDVLDLVVARGRTAEIIRPVRRVGLDLPEHVRWDPPPEDLILTRTPRYAGKA